MDKKRIYFNQSSKLTLGVEAKGLGCRREWEQLAAMVENNQAPYKHQIIQYEKNNELTDIVKDSINRLKSGMVLEC